MTSAEKLTAWFGASGARLVLAVAAVLVAALIIGSGALIVVAALRSGLTGRALVSALFDLLALALWLRIVRSRWLQLRTLDEAASGEPTGIWGVGGPGVRVPGGTGIFKMPVRRDSDDDTEGGGSS